MIAELTGVVLAGGRSSRFGANKALARWQATTMVEQVVNSLLIVMPNVLVVTKKPAELAFLEKPGVRVIKDLHKDGHPMGGLFTALKRLKTSHAFVAACDMPFVRPELIEKLWLARADYDAAIPVWQGRRQPLCGIYSRQCLGLIRACIGQEALGITNLFDCLRTRFMLEQEIQEVDPQGLSFMDIDTPEDYQRAKGLKPC